MIAGVGAVLRNVAFYAAFYGLTAGYVLAALIALPFSRRAFMVIVVGWSRFHRLCVTALLGIRVEVRGALPQESALIAMKHESFFEAIDLPGFLNRPAIFAKAELLRIPLWGKAGAAYGLVAVHRDQGAKALRAMIAASRAYAGEGRMLAIFPEGSRVRHGAHPPLQSGFAGIYKLLGLPVVPIAVNSGPLYHRRWKRRGVITIVIGEPIPAGLPRGEVESRVHAAINALNAPADSDQST